MTTNDYKTTGHTGPEPKNWLRRDGRCRGRALKTLVGVLLALSVLLCIRVGAAVREDDRSARIDASLIQDGHIQGTVTGREGTTPLDGIQVCTYGRIGGEWKSGSCDSTSANGGYDIAELEAGTYRVEFQDPSGAYVSEYYDDAIDPDYGTDVVVGPGETVSGIDATLALVPIYGYHIRLPLLNSAQP